jgi:hypothetical protein
VIALAAYSLGQRDYPGPQDSQNQAAAQPNAKLSKKERKQLEKEDKKARKQERTEEKHEEKQQAKEQRKQYKEQEKEVARERNRELKEQKKEVAIEQKKDQKYQHAEAQRAEKAEARDVHRQIAHEARVERASAVATPPRYVYVPRIPVSTTATPGLLVAQREVSRAIYSQLPGSDVRVLLNGGNQIVLRGAAPTPSLRQRLLQLAVGAARGYSVLDQLAANLVSNAAGSATSAAIGGVSNLIHGSGVKDNSPESGPEPPPDSAISQQAPMSSQHSLPNSDLPAMASALDAGSNACLNLASSSQVILTGQAPSQSSADLIRRFAHQLASPSVPISDQLAVRTNGVPSAGNTPPELASASGAAATSSANSPATVVSPGSTICLTENNGEIFLTGTVGSTADLGTVENAVQPLVGSGRLLDHLTIAGLSSGTQIADSAPVDSTAGPTPAVHASATQQTEVEQALHSIPRLANVNVQVAGDGVHLSGSVNSTEDDQMAANLARQYAPGLAVMDNLAVASGNHPPRF